MPESTTPYPFDRKPRRKAEFIRPPNTLKQKVGSGGLSEEILNRAQALLENNTVDFRPLGEMYLDSLMRAIHQALSADLEKDNPEQIISAMLYPTMQLKANGGMFHYPLVSQVADSLISFLESIDVPDRDAAEIVLAFHTSIRAVIMGKVTGTGGRYGDELREALVDACSRYFERHPDKITKA
ncbi:MAG: hypothetical protein H6862_01915 [Rhodospirillales bacterium]|nr:hypothetical protein [Rhodospirillales bacterium]